MDLEKKLDEQIAILEEKITRLEDYNAIWRVQSLYQHYLNKFNVEGIMSLWATSVEEITMEAGDSGVGKKELENKFSDDILIIPRIRDLVTDKMAILDKNDKYRLTFKGIIMARLFTSFRKLLNITAEGG